MKITSVEITKTENNRRQLADVTIIIDGCLLIKNIKLINNGRKIFVEFSRSQRRCSDYTSPDVVPLNSDVRQYIEKEVISEYRRSEAVNRL
ncbi:MAG: septation protein SpoVG family protein [Clostridia bacterium]|nr:septation protein SpoVG family protein [Clostridia bacterium]